MPRRYEFLAGVGGIGSGMFVTLRGEQTLGRSESRAGTILRRRDFCKLHIVAHYVAVLTRAGRGAFTVLPIGKVGDDPAGSAMIETMRRAGMDTRFVQVEQGASTLWSLCFVYPDGDGGNITTDDSASSRVGPEDVDRALSALPAGLADRPGIALALPEVPLAARVRLAREGRRRGWLAAGAVTTGEVSEALERGLPAGLDVLSLNREEAAAVGGASPDDPPERIVRAAAERLAGLNPSLRLCVTFGPAGACAWADGAMEFVPAPAVEPVNTAGAGDALLAGLIVGLAADLPFHHPGRRRRSLADEPLRTAMDLGVLLAGVSVTSEDTINFAADAEAIRALARRIGADAAGLEPALEWS